METKLTFDEEIAVASAISLRILDLNKTISDCAPLGLDAKVLIDLRDSLQEAYRKFTGVEFKLVKFV